MKIGLPQDRAERGSYRRRWALTVVAAGVIAVLLAIAAGWFIWLPAYRPALAPGESYGIDVSAYQHQIDWHQVARQHISFAYIKATEGATWTDSMFAANWSGAASVGIPHGAYHFFSLCSTGAAQAQNFLRAHPAAPGGLAPAIDLELAGNCSRRPPPRAVAVQLNSFVRLVEAATRQRVVIYLGSDFAHHYNLTLYSRHQLWIRRFLLRPTGRWTIWQVDGNAHVGGIHGDVDLDIGRA